MTSDLWFGVDPADAGLADYRDKSPSAARMGKAAELLVAAACILTTRGKLNVSTSLVDDEGVDLVFNRRGGTSTLAVQVKARMSDSKRVQGDSVMAFVRSQTFVPRPDLDLLVVAVEVMEARLMAAWLIPSAAFADGAGKPNKQGRLRFYASMRPQPRDKWRGYRLTATELAPGILKRIAELDGHRAG